MSTLTIRLPDDKHARLRALAQARAISINRLMAELATVALAVSAMLSALLLPASPGTAARQMPG